MVACAVPTCKNDSRKQNKINNNITFHRFPKSLEIKDAWVKAIKRPDWEPNIRSFVCSIHFNFSSMLETKKGLRKLAQDAVPELHLGDKSMEKKDESRKLAKTVTVILNDSPQKRMMRRRIQYLQEIAKRRQVRCNTLYSKINRMEKKITCLTTEITVLRQKLLIKQEQSTHS